MNSDERLKERLMELSKNGYAIISVYNPDVTVKNRKNTKKTRHLQDLIIEFGFRFKPYSTTLANKEVKTDFIVFDKFDDGFNETGMKLSDFIESCKNHFKFFTVQYNLEEYLKDKTFYHPILKSEKEAYLKINEVILTDLFEPPSSINGWYVERVFSENHIWYGKRGYLCSISELPDGTWQRAYGTIRPIGVMIKKEIVNSRQEAFSDLKDI